MNGEMSDRELAQIGLLGIDIDGTMLRTDGTMSARTKAALHAADAAGIHVVPTTGRPFIVSRDVIAELELGGHWIFANGAITRHLGRDETVRAHWIDSAIAKRFVRDLRASVPGARFAVEFEIDVAFEHGFEKIVPAVPPGESVDDVLPFVDGLVQKVLVFDESVDLDTLYREVTDALDGRGVASYSGLRFIEVSAAEVTKGGALDLLATDLGLNAAQVATFGDNHNDVSMLSWAGFGFAMGNATDDAKEAANHVIDHTDDDGLAVVVERIARARTSLS